MFYERIMLTVHSQEGTWRSPNSDSSHVLIHVPLDEHLGKEQ